MNKQIKITTEIDKLAEATSSNSSETYSSDDFELKGVIKVSIAENEFTKSLDNVEK